MIQIDIDIPVNCACCPFTRAINTYTLDSMCVLTKKKANEMRYREKWCPLKEVIRCSDCAVMWDRPKGKWVDHKYDGNGYDPKRRYECPNCGIPLGETEFDSIVYNFCPVCGADLREGKK